jgi:hypothetical protein
LSDQRYDPFGDEFMVELRVYLAALTMNFGDN